MWHACPKGWLPFVYYTLGLCGQAVNKAVRGWITTD